MSFILDALKKSDKKRQETAAPRIDTVHASPASTSNKKALWVVLLIFVVLLNAGFLGWYFSQSREAVDPAPTQPASTAAAPAPETPPSAPAAPAPRPKVVSQQSDNRVVVQQRSVGPVAGERLYAISELPENLQRRIPSLHMSLHAHNKANPAAGLVRVNGQILRPGAKLDGKYLLEEIKADGAVFKFEGYRFLLPRS